MTKKSESVLLATSVVACTPESNSALTNLPDPAVEWVVEYNDPKNF